MVKEVAPKAIRNYFQPIFSTNQLGIANVPITVNNFELKPGLIQMAREVAYRDVPPRTLINTFELSWRYVGW